MTQLGEGMTKEKTLTDELRKAMRECGLTQYRIARESGLTEAALSRFRRGIRSLSLLSAERLAASLGLRLTAERPRASKLGTGKRRAGGK